MSAGTKFGNFNVNVKEWQDRLKSVLNGTFVMQNLDSKNPWYDPKKSIGQFRSNFMIHDIYYKRNN